ncbi:MAG: autotransporter domain-containing protein [Pseudomonadota bacterium]
MTLSATGLLLSTDDTLAACVDTGGNTFDITSGAGIDLPADCSGASDDAIVTVTGDITGQIDADNGPVENWILRIDPGVNVENSFDVIDVGRNDDVTMRLENSGTITGTIFDGVTMRSGGTVINTASGTIAATSNALSLGGPTVTVVNSGTLQSTAPSTTPGIAIILVPTGTFSLINTAGAVITGAEGAFISAGDGTIVNAGTIDATSGLRALRMFGLDADTQQTLELHPGSVINGTVETDMGIHSLVFGGTGTDTFNVSDIDAGSDTEQYRGFDLFEKTGDSVWQFTGTDAVEIDWTIEDGAIRLLSPTAISANGSITLTGGTLDVNDLTSETGALSATSGMVDLGSGRLTFGGDNTSTSFAGAFTGTGAFTKIGAGTFTYTGTSTHTGLSRIVEGTFVNNGVLTAPIVVSADTLYTGDGTSGDLTVEADGVVAPGESIGTLIVDGDLVSAGELRFDIDDTDADLIDVRGTVDLDGTAFALTNLRTEPQELIQRREILIANDGNDAVIGTVEAPSELNADGTLFYSLSTTSGSGNDVAYVSTRTEITLDEGAVNSEEVEFPTAFPGFTFTVEEGDSATFAGVFSEETTPIDVTKIGDGTLTITGTNTYTGVTRIDAGALINNGRLASPVIVNEALYGGDGWSGDLTINSGGAVAPGNSIGRLAVAGDLTFNAGSTYHVEIDPDGTSDRIVASGTATISSDGTTIAATGDPLADYPQTQTFTIIAAEQGVDGQFETVTDTLPDIDLVATYTDTEVQLTYQQAVVPDDPGEPDEPGEPDHPDDPDMPDVTPKVVHPSALMGGLYASDLFASKLTRRGALLSQLPAGGGDVLHVLGFMPGSRAPTALPPHALAADMPRDVWTDPDLVLADIKAADIDNWGVWGAFLGEQVDIDDRGGIPGWDADTLGAAFGFERVVNGLGFPAFAGLGFGYTTSSVSVDASDADIKSFHIGAYSAMARGPFALSGTLAYAYQDYDMTRPIVFDGGTLTAEGDASGHSITAATEAFYDVAHARSDLRLGPLASVDVLHARRDGFTETGAGILNLHVQDDDVTQVVTGLGAMAGYTGTLGTATVTTDVRIAWEHAFGDLQTTTVSEIPLADAVFATSSAAADADRLLVGFGTALQLTDAVRLHGTYSGQFSNSTTVHQGSAGLTVGF